MDGLEKRKSIGIPGKGQYTEEARTERLAFAERVSGQSLPGLHETSVTADSLRGNIENYLTSVEIPVGLAGPLYIRGSHLSGNVYAPLATTEGALVASVSRGATAITRSGGVEVRALRQRMTRAPIFELRSVQEAVVFGQWILEQKSRLQEVIKKYSNYAELLDLDVRLFGRSAHVRFIYSTKDAAGQNMTTICTWNALRWILKKCEAKNEFRILGHILEGGLSADKKASHLSAIEGRGTEVVCEAVIPKKVAKEILFIDPVDVVHKVNLAKGARLHSGMVGWNVNVSNVIAAIFAATGQDLGCVHESSLGETHVELRGEDLAISVHLPCLVVGTVGGGTRLPKQSEMLKLLGCVGPQSSMRFAEIIGGFCVALELSTMAAMISGHFASAHEKLGRKQSSRWLRRAELDLDFVSECIQADLRPGEEVVSIEEDTEPLIGDSMIMEMSSLVSQKLCGFFKFKVLSRLDGADFERQILLKVKPGDKEVIEASTYMADMWSEDLGREIRANQKISPFCNSHIREIEMARRVEGLAPKTYKAVINRERQLYYLCQEWLDQLENKDTAGDVSVWSKEHVLSAIKGITTLHSKFLTKTKALEGETWLQPAVSHALLVQNSEQNRIIVKSAPQILRTPPQPEALSYHAQLVQNVRSWSANLEILPKTLIHHDFNPRNLAFKSTAEGLRPVFFDWELATIHVPQRDVMELLCFVLGEKIPFEWMWEALEFHRQQLETMSGVKLHKSEWIMGASLAVKEFIYSRLSMYLVAQSQRNCDFLERTYWTSYKLATLLDEKVNSEDFNGIVQ